MYTIIIPSVGRINFLNSLLESINNQTILPEEIILLLDKNNYCKNQSKMIKRNKNCNLIFCENLTLPEKRNFGVKVSKTNLIIFSDDDDIWDNKKAELTIKSLRTNQVVCHEYSKFGFIDKQPSYRLGKKKKLISINALLYGNNIFGGGSGIAARKEILLSIPFSNYSSCEDYDWWIKVILAEIKIEYIPISLVKYRVHDRNMTANFLKIFKYNRKIFKKLIYKSVILFLTYIFGYLKAILSILVKCLNLVFIKLVKN